MPRMAAHHKRFARLLSIAALVAALMLTLTSASGAWGGDTILVWKVGSPHDGDTPSSILPLGLRREADARGMQIGVEVFAAKGFAAKFAEAVARGGAPDVILFNNLGVMEGITTKLGKFEGIGENPEIRRHFIRVTDAFRLLFGRETGWAYLFDLSPNHGAARALGLRAPQCANGSSEPGGDRQLIEIAPRAATAYVSGDAIGLQPLVDGERSSTSRPPRDPESVGAVRLCGVWGNDKLAFVTAAVSYDSRNTIGTTPLLLVFRKVSSQWRLLTAARDPISTGAFADQAASIAALLSNDGQTGLIPAPATLLSPLSGILLRPPPPGQRFASFTWLSSPSDDVVAEIAEFAYDDDARLFFRRPAGAQSNREVSAGELWSTHGEWRWRVWSVSRTGDVAFSEARGFRH